MINGTYQVVLHTTMGKKNGSLNVQAKGETIGGTLSIMNYENLIDEGRFDGNHCILKGLLNTLMGEVSYTIVCVIEGDILNGTVKTSKGDMRLTGKKQTD